MTDAAATPANDDRTRLARIVDGIADSRRQIAALHAQEAAFLTEALEYALERMDPPSVLPERPRDIPLRSVAAEIGSATRLSDRSAQARMSDAHTLTTRFPLTHVALADGRIDRPHAAVIAEAGAAIDDDDARREYEKAILPVAERETSGRLRAVAERLAQRIHPIPLDERHRAARRTRRIWVHDRNDSMSEFGALIPTHLAHGMFDRVTQLAQAVAAAPGEAGGDELEDLERAPHTDDRLLDEIRADVLCDLLLTGHANAEQSEASIPASDAIRARVQITVPVLSLLGASDEPADLAGRGPISLDIARGLAADAPGWDRVLTHPITGCVLAVDRYRPFAEQKRVLGVRDEHCRFPGCRQPVHRCDLDHTVAYEHGGATSICNLAHLCKRHHKLKHHSAWRVRQLGGGVLEWTSPIGRVYTDLPARTLGFVPEHPPPF